MDKFDDKQDYVELQGLLADSPDTPLHTADAFQTIKSSRHAPITPLPWLQLGFVALWRSSQPLVFAVISPYINQFLVQEIHVSDEVHVGHYSGFVTSATAVGMCLGLFVSASLSDKYGRKPVALIGITSSSILCILLGTAKQYWQLVVIRFFMGLTGSAQAATAKVMVSEFCDSTNVAKGYAFVGLGWQIGCLIAPILGGVLSEPARTWPGIFAGTWFERYPFALPGMVVGAIPLIGVVFAIFLAEESHPELRKPKVGSLKGFDKSHQIERMQVKSGSTNSILQRIRDTIRPSDGSPNIFSCGVAFILLLFALLIMNIVGSAVSELLLFFSSPAIGGLGLDKGQMSIILSVRPLLLCFYEINCFPRLVRKFGTERLMRILVCIWPIYIGVYFCLASASLAGFATPAVEVCALGLALLLQMLGNPAFICGDVLIPARAPISRQLTLCVTFGEFLGQVAVTIGASGGSTLFAHGAALPDGDWLKAKLVWLVLIATTSFSALLTQRLTHIDGWREKEEKFGDSLDTHLTD